MNGIITGIVAGLRAWAAIKELELRRALISEIEECEDESQTLEKEYLALRAAGDDAGADRLLQRQVRRAVLSEFANARLLGLEDGPGVYGDEAGAVGVVPADAGQGPADPRPAGSPEDSAGKSSDGTK